MNKLFVSLVKYSVEQRITDLHITPFHPVVMRRDGQVFPHKDIAFSGSDLDALAEELMAPRHKQILRSRWSVDFSMFYAGANLRLHIASTARGLSMAVRFLPGEVPSIEQLNLHPSLKELSASPSGLIIFCGATGSGKSSTIAAMLGEINRTRACHVVTLEDPVEYRFSSGKAFIEQRELGVHFQSFEQALLDALRQMPDVILVGELRQPEIMRQTLNIAESGHLVFTTLHASTPEEAVYRICNSFPLDAQELIRYQLATVLKAVIVQRLVLVKREGFRVPLLSIMRGSTAIRTAIRDNKLSQLEGIVDISKGEGMFTFKRYQEEFLGRKDRFVKPTAVFKPSSAKKPETAYMSRLIDYGVMRGDGYSGAGATGGFGGGASYAPAQEAGGQAPVLDVTDAGGGGGPSGEIDDYIRQLEGGGES